MPNDTKFDDTFFCVLCMIVLESLFNVFSYYVASEMAGMHC